MTKQKSTPQRHDHEWRTIVGFPDYQINAIGEVYSLRYSRYLQGTRSRGYKVFLVSVNKKKAIIYAGRAILEAFVGPPPVFEGRVYACHRDSNPGNNHWKNLYWGTARQNSDDRKTVGRYAPGKRGGLSDLTEDDVRDIRASKMAQESIAKLYSVSGATISHIRTRKTWAHME